MRHEFFFICLIVNFSLTYFYSAFLKTKFETKRPVVDLIETKINFEPDLDSDQKY